jgi:uncharacterized protein with PIN domain
MGWIVTGLVLGSVSVLVVALSTEQASQSVHADIGASLSRSRSVLSRIFLHLAALSAAAGREVTTLSRSAAGRLAVAAVHLGREFRSAVRSADLRWGRGRGEPTSSRRQAHRLRFEECLQVTSPEIQSFDGRERLVLAPMPAGPSLAARILAAVELVAIIVVAGGALAVALVAMGWKAARLF